MKTDTFTGNTLDGARQLKDRWLAEHRVRVIKELRPVVMRIPAGPYQKPEEGKIDNVTIALEYEDC